jgi:hypothetical protein
MRDTTVTNGRLVQKCPHLGGALPTRQGRHQRVENVGLVLEFDAEAGSERVGSGRRAGRRTSRTEFRVLRHSSAVPRTRTHVPGGGGSGAVRVPRMGRPWHPYSEWRAILGTLSLS